MANNLKIILKEQGRNSIWLRKALRSKGIRRNPATISRWCTRKHDIRDSFVVDAICEILDVSEDQLIGKEEVPEAEEIPTKKKGDIHLDEEYENDDEIENDNESKFEGPTEFNPV